MVEAQRADHLQAQNLLSFVDNSVNFINLILKIMSKLLLLLATPHVATFLTIFLAYFLAIDRDFSHFLRNNIAAVGLCIKNLSLRLRIVSVADTLGLRLFQKGFLAFELGNLYLL